MRRKGNIDSSDRRVRYTKMVIRQSFLALLRKEPLSKISVTEICNDADLNRGTFYAYYSDPTDLYNQIQSNLFDELKKPLDEMLNGETLYEILLDVLRAIKSNDDICTIILSDSGHRNFLERVLGLAKDKIVQLWRQQNPSLSDSMIDYMFLFSAHGCISILLKWLTDDNENDTPEKIARMIDDMTTAVASCFITADDTKTLFC